MAVPHIVFLAVFALLLLNSTNAAASINAEETVVRNAIDDALSQLRHIILNGDSERGIPVLDPMEVEKWDFAVDEPAAICAEGSLSDVRLEGLGSFVVERSTIQIAIIQAVSRVYVGIRLPAVSATGKYRLSSVAHPGASDSLDAQGDFTVVVKDISFTLKVVISLTFKVRSVDVTLGIGDVFIDVQGAGDVGDLINNEAADRIQTWFADNRSALEQEAAAIIKAAIESSLDKQTQARIPFGSR